MVVLQDVNREIKERYGSITAAKKELGIKSSAQVRAMIASELGDEQLSSRLLRDAERKAGRIQQYATEKALEEETGEEVAVGKKGAISYGIPTLKERQTKTLVAQQLIADLEASEARVQAQRQTEIASQQQVAVEESGVFDVTRGNMISADDSGSRSGFKVRELVQEFGAGFTFNPSPGTEFSGEEALEIALTGRNPKTGEVDTAFEQRMKEFAYNAGLVAALASAEIGGAAGSGIAKIPGVGKAAQVAGGVVTSEPVVAGLTVVAGKELVESGQQGSEEFARTGANLMKDVALFSGFIQGAGVKKLDLMPIKSETITVPTTQGEMTATTFGFDIGKGRAQPVVTLTPEGTKFGTPKFAEPISIEQLSAPIAQPETAVGGKVFQELIAFTPQETARIGALTTVSQSLGTTKGLSPSEVIVKVPGLETPKTSSKLIEAFGAQNEGVFFGSIVTERLPDPFKSARIGDVDIFFPKKSVEEITPLMEGLTKDLVSAGEQVMFNPEKLSIDFIGGGGKLLEAKSGINQEVLGLDDVAPERWLGFQMTTEGVPFGQAQSITAGQQLIRKGSGASMVSPPSSAAEFSSFASGGVVGKISAANPRGTKDIAGFIQMGSGLAELQGGARGQRAGRALAEYVQSFTPEQRADIFAKLNTMIGEGTFFALESPLSKGTTRSPLLPSRTPSKATSGSPLIDTSFSASVASEASKTTKSGTSGSPSISPSSIVSDYSLFDVSYSFDVSPIPSYSPISSTISRPTSSRPTSSQSPYSPLPSSLSPSSSATGLLSPVSPVPAFSPDFDFDPFATKKQRVVKGKRSKKQPTPTFFQSFFQTDLPVFKQKGVSEITGLTLREL